MVSLREARNLVVLSCGEDDWVGSASFSHWGIPRLVQLPVLIPTETRCAIRGRRAVTITLIFTFPFINESSQICFFKSYPHQLFGFSGV